MLTETPLRKNSLTEGEETTTISDREEGLMTPVLSLRT
jgi:hypothetical protein